MAVQIYICHLYTIYASLARESLEANCLTFMLQVTADIIKVSVPGRQLSCTIGTSAPQEYKDASEIDQEVILKRIFATHSS